MLNSKTEIEALLKRFEDSKYTKPILSNDSDFESQDFKGNLGTITKLGVEFSDLAKLPEFQELVLQRLLHDYLTAIECSDFLIQVFCISYLKNDYYFNKLEINFPNEVILGG